MTTKLFTAKRNDDGVYSLDDAELLQAANFLKAGQLVVFPTETVYGIGALVNKWQAIKNIFLVKGRPQDNPLILHVDSLAMLKRYVQPLNEVELFLIEHFMPGPITFIMRRSKLVNNAITAHLDTVGIRMPSNPIARRLISYCGEGIAAPSANISGRPSPTNSQAVVHDFWNKVPCIIDGGDSAFGVESTILDLSQETFHILRPGAISAEQLNAALVAGGFGKLVLEQHDYYLPNLKAGDAPKAPGMKYRHYAPEAKVKILHGDQQEMTEAAESFVEACLNENKSAKITTFVSHELYNSWPEDLKKKVVEPIFFEDYACHAELLPKLAETESELDNLHKMAFQAANGLFKALRQADLENVDLILVEAVEAQGMAQAYMNRLTKAESK